MREALALFSAAAVVGGGFALVGVATAATAAPIKTFKSCADVREHYSGGIAKSTGKLYQLNIALDKDKDGTACER